MSATPDRGEGIAEKSRLGPFGRLDLDCDPDSLRGRIIDYDSEMKRK